MIRCSDCKKGMMVQGMLQDYDASDLVGLDTVILHHAPALVCDRCGHIMFEGKVVEEVTLELARLLVRNGEELRPQEVRFLREIIGMTQAELAGRLGLSRATVNRWETGSDGTGSVSSLAIRTLAAWSLNDAELAREIGAPKRAPSFPLVLPYEVSVRPA